MWLMVILYAGTLTAGQIQVIPYSSEIACETAISQKGNFYGDDAEMMCYYDDEFVRFLKINVGK